MEYLKKIDSIIDKIQDFGKTDSATHLLSLKRDAFTSTELLMSVTHEMINLIKRDRELKETIEKDVLELTEYCKSIGLNV